MLGRMTPEVQSDGGWSTSVARALAWAERAYRACDVCPEDCRVDRLAGPGGVCGLGADARVYKEYLHFGEERRLVPSHTVYLTGCNFRCAFCSDWEPVTEPLARGGVVAPDALARRIALRRAQGARNVNFVGGLPDVNVLYVLKVLEHASPDTHVVWNTNLWSSRGLVEHLAPIVGTWLVDLKFGDDACALKLARARGYWATLTARLDDLARLAPGRTIIRHLLMPGHLACCTEPVLRWLAATRPGVPVNLMTGYHPFRLARAARSPLARAVPPGEIAEAIALFRNLPFADPMIDGLEPRNGAEMAPVPGRPSDTPGAATTEPQ